MSNNNKEESIDSKYTILEQKGKGYTSYVYKVKDKNTQIFMLRKYIKNLVCFFKMK